MGEGIFLVPEMLPKKGFCPLKKLGLGRHPGPFLIRTL